MPWTRADYKRAEEHLATLKGDEPGYDELNAAVTAYEDSHQDETEERGAKEGFITQLYPTSGPQLAPQEDLPPDIEGQKLIEQTSRPSPPPPEHIVPGVLGVKPYLPYWMGGGTEYWEEPTLFDFHAATGKKNLGRESPEYAEYADKKWTERYMAAQQNGDNVIRMEKALPSEADAFMAKKAAEASSALLPNALGAAVGLSDMASGRTLLNEDQRKYVEDEAPVGFGLGSLFGAAEGVPEAAFERGAEITGLKTALQASQPSVAGAAARGVGAGAIGAGLTEGIAELDAAAKGEKTGDPDRNIINAMLFGGGGGALAGGGGAMSRGLRGRGERGRELRIIEKANGAPATRLNPFSPLEVPNAAESALMESMGPGVNEGAAAPDILASRVAPDIAKRAIAEEASTVKAIGDAETRYYNTRAGRAQVVPHETANAIQGIISERTFNTGKALMAAEPGTFQRLMGQAVEAIPVLPGKSAQQIADLENGRVVSLFQARQMGLPMDLPPMNAGQELQTQVIIKPRPLNAQQMDEVVKGVDRLAKAATKQGAADEGFAELQRATRADRGHFRWDPALGNEPPDFNLADGTPVTGYNKFQHFAGQRLSDIERRMTEAGIPQGGNVTEEQAAAGIEGKARNFRNLGSRASDEALLSFSAPGPLFDVAASRFVDTAGQGVEAGTRSSAIRSGRLAIDPVTRFFERAAVPIGTAVGVDPHRASREGRAGYHDAAVTFTDLMRLLQQEQPR